jgi:hypothetical protein
MPKKEKKSSTPWLLLAAGAGALWYFFGGSASAATSSPVMSASGQKYMTQIMTAQNAYLQGQTTQAVYNAAAAAIIVAATADPTVTAQDVTNLHAVAGV